MAAEAGTRRVASPGAFGRIVDTEQARYALNVALATVLTLYISFVINLDNTFWALLTIVLIVRPESGTMVWRSTARLVGTLLGALVGLVFVGLFAQSPPAMIAALCLWIFGTGFLARLEIGTDSYAYGTAGLTALIITLDTGPNTDLAYGFALARATETVIPIVASFMVLLVVFPKSVTSVALDGIKQSRKHILELVPDAVADEPRFETKVRRAAITALLGVVTNLRAQSFERSRKRWLLPRMTAVTTALVHVMYSADALLLSRRTLGRLDPGDRVETERRKLLAILQSFPEERSSCEETLADVERLTVFLDGVQPRSIVDDARAAGREPSENEITRASALFRLQLFASRIRDLLNAEANLLDPRRPAARVRKMGSRYRDLVAAFEYGARPMIVFLILAVIWLQSGWTSGRNLTLIGGALTLLLPLIAPRAARIKAGIMIGYGYLVGAILSLALIAVLPFMESFAAFALVMGSTVFVIFYIAGAKALPLAIGTILMIAIATQPANMQSFSSIGVFVAAAGLCFMPLAFISGLAILFPENQAWLKRHLARGGTALLKRATAPHPMDGDSFFAQSIDILGDYANDLDLDDEGSRHLIGRTRSIAIAGLECYEIRQIAADPSFPAPLRQRLPELFAAVRQAGGAIRSKDVTNPSRVFGAIHDENLAYVRRPGIDPETRACVFRFGAIVELLHMLVEGGHLALDGQKTETGSAFADTLMEAG